MEYNVTLSWNCLPSHRGESFGFIPEIVLDSFLEGYSHDLSDKILSSLIEDLLW